MTTGSSKQGHVDGNTSQVNEETDYCIAADEDDEELEEMMKALAETQHPIPLEELLKGIENIGLMGTLDLQEAQQEAIKKAFEILEA